MNDNLAKAHPPDGREDMVGQTQKGAGNLFKRVRQCVSLSAPGRGPVPGGGFTQAVTVAKEAKEKALRLACDLAEIYQHADFAQRQLCTVENGAVAQQFVFVKRGAASLRNRSAIQPEVKRLPLRPR